jgi:flagella basal body P-ring formation protein FlgA
VAAGEPIRLDRLERPALIHRGDHVTLVYRKGALRIKTIAWAAEDAALGQRVRLRLTRRGKDYVTAVCTAARTAAIQAPGDGSVHAAGGGPGEERDS